MLIIQKYKIIKSKKIYPVPAASQPTDTIYWYKK